jgi:thiol:disulfide interchange protein/DsbC/DsbD-like thiol-disulfide interchange protein
MVIHDIVAPLVETGHRTNRVMRRTEITSPYRTSARWRALTTAVCVAVAFSVGAMATSAAAEPTAKVTWLTSYTAAMAKAKAENKPLLMDWWAVWCKPCLKLGKITFKDPTVTPLFDGFVLVKLDHDADENEAHVEAMKLGQLPQVFFLKPDGTVLKDLTLSKYEEPAAFAQRMHRARKALGLPALGEIKSVPKSTETAEPTGGKKTPDTPKTGQKTTPKPAVKLHPSLLKITGSAFAKKPHVTARLITSHQSVSPGSKFEAGVHLTLDPGWRVYWVYPSASKLGLPTEVVWQHPEGFTSTELKYPAPKVFTEKDADTGKGTATYGYDKEVVFTSTVIVPRSAKPGSSFELTAMVEWLTCRERCIAGNANLTTTVKIAAQPAPAESSPVFAAWSERYANNVTPKSGFTVTAGPEADHIRAGAKTSFNIKMTAPDSVSLETPKSHPVFVPSAIRALYVTDIKSTINNGVIDVTMTVSATKDTPTEGSHLIGGVVSALVDGKLKHFSVMEPIHFSKPAIKVHPSLLKLPKSAVAVKPRVTARLILNKKTIKPGDPFRAGVHFTLDPGWHIYWIYPNAGALGLPTEVVWVNSEGLKARALEYPAPHAYSQNDPDLGKDLPTYGYADEVLLQSQFLDTAMLKAGSPLELTASVEWLACRESCIRGEVDLTTTVQVAGESVTSDTHAVFAAWVGRYPKDVDPKSGFTVKAGPKSDHIRAGGKTTFNIKMTAPDGVTLETPKSHPVFIPSSILALHLTDIKATITDGVIDVSVAVSATEKTPSEGSHLIGGVVSALVDGKLKHFSVMEPIHFSEPETPKKEKKTMSFILKMLLFAFLGGLILNIMPCVLPVLSIKALSLVKQADEDRKRIWHHGLMYGLGVLISFWVLAAVLIIMKFALGETILWGLQQTSPVFTMVMCVIVFGFGLSLFGLFEVTLPGMQSAAGASSKSGLTGSFMSGTFATLLATPCSAPLLGPAMGYALQMPPTTIFLFFSMAGLGLAFPFVLIARFPALIYKLPKPGPWMETFKHLMGFLLMAFTVFLVYTLMKHITPASVAWFLAFLCVLAMGLWMYGRFAGPMASRRKQWIYTILAIALVAVAGKYTLGFEHLPEKPVECDKAETSKAGIAWHGFSKRCMGQFAAEEKTVFIDFTADWCLSCKENENRAIETEKVSAKIKELGIVAVKGDFTRGTRTKSGKEIAKWLKRFERGGVPLYVVLPANNHDRESAVVLGEFITEGQVLEALDKAGPSRKSAE